jgi:bifunctional non-homologous end joining protein LigD
MATRQSIKIHGKTLALSNREKPLYPSGFHKAAVIDYYARVFAHLLPHLRTGRSR